MSELTVLNFISPSFTHEKLEKPSFIDLVDVFEDRMNYWFFQPISILLDNPPHCDFAAVAQMVNYFEAIETYFTGKDSTNSSAKFFASGFGRVFPVNSQEPNLQGIIGNVMYTQVRCGFAHDGFSKYRVFLIRNFPEPVRFTFVSGKVTSITINPTLFFNGIRIHFDRYIKKLRNNPEAAVKLAFENAVRLKWGLDEPDPYIGMTQDEFFRE